MTSGFHPGNSMARADSACGCARAALRNPSNTSNASSVKPRNACTSARCTTSIVSSDTGGKPLERRIRFSAAARRAVEERDDIVTVLPGRQECGARQRLVVTLEQDQVARDIDRVILLARIEFECPPGLRQGFLQPAAGVEHVREVPATDRRQRVLCDEPAPYLHGLFDVSAPDGVAGLETEHQRIVWIEGNRFRQVGSSPCARCCA